MPTFYGKYETPATIAKQRQLWLELVKASLPPADLPGYTRALQSLFIRFLDKRTAPSHDEILAVTGELLDELRDAALDEEGRYTDDGRYLTAARHLQRAQRLLHNETRDAL